MFDEKTVKFVDETVEKTRRGRLRWEPTANGTLFVAALGGQFTIVMSKSESRDRYGNAVDFYGLQLKDDQDRILVEVDNSTDGVTVDELVELYELARRHGLRVDEKLDRVLGELAKL